MPTLKVLCMDNLYTVMLGNKNIQIHRDEDGEFIIPEEFTKNIHTALKPAYEPIILARKPVEGTIAQNVLKYGVGGLNIDGCRVDAGDVVPGGGSGRIGNFAGKAQSDEPLSLHRQEPHTQGRWPANFILSYPEDEFTLRDDVTPQQLHKLSEWMNENAEH